MNRGKHTLQKRQREADKAERKNEKAERRRLRRERGPGEVEVGTAEEMTGDLRSIDEVLRSAYSGETSSRAAAPIPCRLFVGGLSWETSDADLRAAFSLHGVVTDAVVMVDRGTGTSRGFGFVTFENRKDASRAVEAMHNTELNGRRIAVNVATERSR